MQSRSKICAAEQKEIVLRAVIMALVILCVNNGGVIAQPHVSQGPSFPLL